MDTQELHTRFTHHPPSTEQIQSYGLIRNTARSFAELLQRLCPQSRELSLAMTHIEQAVMWANAAIARRSPSGMVCPGCGGSNVDSATLKGGDAVLLEQWDCRDCEASGSNDSLDDPIATP